MEGVKGGMEMDRYGKYTERSVRREMEGKGVKERRVDAR